MSGLRPSRADRRTGPRRLVVMAVSGGQVAPRASRSSRVVLKAALKGRLWWARRAPGAAAVRFAPVWSLRPIILVDYRQPRALARGPAPLEDAARGDVLGRSRGLHVGEVEAGRAPALALVHARAASS